MERKRRGIRDDSENKKGLLYAILIFLAVICLMPFLLMMVNATRTGSEIVKSFTLVPGHALSVNWAIVSSYFNLFKGMANSLLVALPATLFTSYFSAMAAYASSCISLREISS